MRRGLAALALAICSGTAAVPAHPQTEVHFQYGNLDNPFAGTTSGTVILTLQHASFWSLGDNFYFVDFSDDGGDDGFNEFDAYGEWYSNFSLGKLAGRDLGFGPVADLGIFGGLAIGTDANVFSWLPGARIAWRLPGFVFLNTDLMYAIDGGRGADGGSPPALDGRFVLDVNGLLPFRLGSQSFVIAGHAEYQTATANEFGAAVPASILAQPQLLWDIGGENGLLVGVEFQYWRNKLGTDADESALQFLGVWRL